MSIVTSRHDLLLAAIDAVLRRMPHIVNDPALAGAQITFKLGGPTGVRAMIVHPEFRYEAIEDCGGLDACGPVGRRG